MFVCSVYNCYRVFYDLKYICCFECLYFVFLNPLKGRYKSTVINLKYHFFAVVFISMVVNFSKNRLFKLLNRVISIGQLIHKFYNRKADLP